MKKAKKQFFWVSDCCLAETEVFFPKPSMGADSPPDPKIYCSLCERLCDELILTRAEIRREMRLRRMKRRGQD